MDLNKIGLEESKLYNRFSNFHVELRINNFEDSITLNRCSESLLHFLLWFSSKHEKWCWQFISVQTRCLVALPWQASPSKLQAGSYNTFPINFKIHVSKGYHFLSSGLKTYLQGNRMHFLLFKTSSTFQYWCIFYFVDLQPTSIWLLSSLRGSETVTVKTRIKSKERDTSAFLLTCVLEKSDFSVWFLRYFWTKHPMKMVLVGFVTAVHIIIFYSSPYFVTKKVNTNCWV